MVRSNFWITPKDLFASDLHLLHVLQQGLKETGVHYFQEKVPQSPTHCFRPEQCVWNAYPIQTVAVVERCLNLNILLLRDCLLYTSPSPRDGLLSRMPSSA